MGKTKHNKIAEKLSKKFNTPYKSHQGIDLVTPSQVIEVETRFETLDQGINQIVRSDKARYLSVTKRLEKKAIEKTKGTGIGIMSETGQIIKKAARKKNK